MINTTSTATAKGKLIISGEHSAVYGYPAFAIPLPINLTVGLQISNPAQYNFHERNDPSAQFLQHIRRVCEDFFKIKFKYLQVGISSQLPQNSGFGSSAALANAYISAYMQLCKKKLSKKQLFQLVSKCEEYAHTKPSGIDASVIVYQSPLVYVKEHEKLSMKKKAAAFFPLQECILLHSGQATESTKDMVAHVSQHPQRDTILKKIGAVTEKLLRNLDNKQQPWEQITENQRCLEELGVVSQKAMDIIQHIEALGGNAKVCGAGGIKTGAGAILAHHKDTSALLDHISQNNLQLIYPQDIGIV